MHCVCMEISTKLSTLSLQNCWDRNLNAQIHIPHETYICQTLSLGRTLVIFISPPIMDSYTWSSTTLFKKAKGATETTHPSEIRQFTSSSILHSSATRYCNMSTTQIDTSPKLVENHWKLSFFVLISKPQKKNLLIAELPSFKYAQLFILL
jgi:hypothetical protein